MRRFLLVAAILSATVAGLAQGVPVVREDPALDVAAQQIGRALFLRCFCADSNLAFNAAGALTSPAPKITDWTLAAVDLKTVERKGPDELQLNGVRVAMRFVPERREWERHAQADEKLRITIADPHNPAALAVALEHVFAQGIDAALQRAMPLYWQRYFMPASVVRLGSPSNPPAKPGGTGAAATAAEPDNPSSPGPRVPAVPTYKADAAYTPQAQHDRVQGTVTVRIVIDKDGNPINPVIKQPLGYGLDAATVAAIERFHFTPATEGGKPIPSATDINQEFVLVPVPR